MQMVMIIIGGYVVASTPLVQRAMQRLADVPKTPRQAIALIAIFSELTALISWGMSPIISGLLVRQLTQRVKGLDYRAAGAAAYVGGATVWALGLSSSAAMLMATPERHSTQAARDQRTDSAHQHHLPLAQLVDGRGADRGWNFGGLSVRASGRESANRRVLRTPVGAVPRWIWNREAIPANGSNTVRC